MPEFDQLYLDKISGDQRARFEQHQWSRFGERYTSYRAQLEASNDRSSIPDFPLYVMLEQTFKCNMTCPTCILGNKEQQSRYATPNMTRALYDRIIAECAEHRLPSISMHSTDEPMLVKDIASRVRAAHDAGIMDIILCTNGHLLTWQKIEDLLQAGLTHFLFSVDAATEETYAKVRPGAGTLADVIERIGWVNELRGNSPTPITRVAFVKSSLNQHETEAFKARFSPMVNYIDVQNYSGFEDNRSLAPKGATFFTTNDFHCNSPFHRIVIRANGDVLPCCSSYGYQVAIGNINNDSIFDIWHGERATELRSRLKSGLYPDACRDCAEASVKRA